MSADQIGQLYDEKSTNYYFYHYDGLGNVVALSDSAGDTVQTYEYSIYGQVAASDPNHPNPYLFTGRRFDTETGLYYYRARYYNPYIGRFLQTDPVGYNDGINWYLYCRNNPLARVDPSGRDIIDDEGFPVDDFYIANALGNLFPKPDYPGRWTSYLYFFGWYVHGEGEEVKLVNIELLDDFRNSDQIRPEIDTFQREMDDLAKEVAISAISFGLNGQISITTEMTIDYDFAPSGASLAVSLVTGNPLVVLGSGSVTATATITVRRLQNSEGELTDFIEWSLHIDYSVEDEFKDPGDIFDTTPEEVEWPSCQTYPITADWSYVNGGLMVVPVDQSESG